MIVRYVKMTFKPEHCKEFEALFLEVKSDIAGFEGCNGVSLAKEIDGTGVYFTTSHWHSEESLEAYRHSDLFKKTWSKTKPLFRLPAAAWSLENC